MKKFEYKIVYGSFFENALNKMGDEGWEVCGVFYDKTSSPSYGMVLKREKEY